MSHGTCISKIRNNLKVSSHMIKNSCQVFVCKGYYLILCIDIRTKLRWLVLNDFNMMKKQYLIKTKEKGNFFSFLTYQQNLGSWSSTNYDNKKKIDPKI